MSGPDPLAALVARSLGVAVRDVRSEALGADRERIHFTRDGRPDTLVLERVPVDDALEVQLLPFLARKTDRVPTVHARGIPRPVAPAPPWLLVEDLVDAASACDRDALEIVRAKLAVERAVARDGPALRALGVPALTPADLVARASRASEEARAAAARLAAPPHTLAHGDLRCARARVASRGVVLVGWRRAHLGSGLLDVARLAGDLRQRGLAAIADEAVALYVAETGASGGLVRDAEVVDALLREVART